MLQQEYCFILTYTSGSIYHPVEESVSDLGDQLYDLKSLKPYSNNSNENRTWNYKENNYIHFRSRVMIIAITKNSYSEASINVSTKPRVQGLKEINKYLMMAWYRHMIVSFFFF